MRAAFTRRLFLRNVGLTALGIWAAPLVSACASPGTPPGNQQSTQTPSTGPKPGGILNWYLPDDPPDLDPHMQTTSSLQWVCGMVYNGLLKYDIRPGNAPGSPGANTPVPDLAERWEQPDPLTYVFHLRQGVKFHDGSELTAEDAAFSLNRIRTNKPEFQRAYAFEPVEGVEAVDKYTVRVKMKRPYAAFINQVAAGYTRIAPKHQIEKLGDMKQVMVGTGPFKLKEYRRGVRFVLEKNPEYFIKELPYLNGINIPILPDKSAQLAAFLSGQIDIYDPINVTEFNDIKQRLAGVGSSAYIRGNVYGIALNLRHKPLQDIRVRHALWYAIDQDEIGKVVWQGDYWKHRAVSPSLGDWAVAYEKLPLSDSPNLEKAKQLLRDAGYPNGLELECKTVSRYTQKEAQVVSEQLKRIGVQMNVVDVEYGAFLSARNKGEFQMLAFALAPFGDIEDFTQALFYSKNSRNWGAWGNPELDSLLEAGGGELDPTKRKEIYWKVQQKLAELCYMIDVPRGKYYEVWQQRVQGYVPAENPERGLAYQNLWLA